MPDSIKVYDPPAEMNHPPARVYTRRELLVRRIVFWLGIIGFTLVAALPLLMILLAMMGEFTVRVPGDFPNDQARLWMVMEPRERGIAYSLPRVASSADDQLAVQTNVRYLLWEGENEAIQYCQTYTRTAADEPWQLVSNEAQPCP